MHSRLKLASLATATVLTVVIPFCPVPDSQYSAAAQTTQNRKTEADRLVQQGDQQIQNKQFETSIASLQQALSIYQQINDLEGKANALLKLGLAYGSLSQYEKGITYYQQALPLFQQLQKQSGEAEVLMNLGYAYGSLSQYDKAIVYYQQVLPIFRQVKDRGGEAWALNYLGVSYRFLSQNEKAIYHFQQALPLFQQLQDRNGEAYTLDGIASMYLLLHRFPQALEIYQQALTIHQQLGDLPNEASTLSQIGLTYSSLNQYPLALEAYQQALAIHRKLGDLPGESSDLNGLGSVYESLGQSLRALEMYEKSLAIERQLSDRSSEASTLSMIGGLYKTLGQYPQSLEALQKAAAIERQLGDRSAEISTVSIIALVYEALGQPSQVVWEKFLEADQQTLDTYQRSGERSKEARTLYGIGATYLYLKQYPKALESFQQALALHRPLGEREREAITLESIGTTYETLGKFSKALETLQQTLAVYRQLGNRSGETHILHDIGTTYERLGQSSKALETYQQALTIQQQLGDRLGETLTLQSIEMIYEELRQPAKALETSQQLLAIYREVGDRAGESNALYGIANIYYGLNQYSQVLEFYQKVLAINHEVGDLTGEGHMFSNIGDFLSFQKQPELAIAFYKQSVNTYEIIRKDLQNNKKIIAPEVQASYTESIAKTYRNLANLLLQKNRIIEALKVLDLLKVQDLQDFLKDTKGNTLTAKGLELLPGETTILKTFNALSQRSQTTFFQNPTIQTQVQALQRTAAAQNLKLNAYQDLQARIKKLGNHVALFYPLILDDRLELVILTNGGIPIHKPVPISRQQITSEVETFRQQLQTRSPLVKQPAQQLYQHLIQPLEAELKTAGVTTIVYAPDSILRYVPLSALHDGKQWLAQRYQITYLTALALTPLDPAPTQTPHVLAGAVTRSYSPIVNGQKYPFPALSQTQAEVEQLAQRYPNTQLLIDDRLNRQTIETNLEHSTIVHLATHAAFVSGSPDASFILLGDGSTLSLRDLNDLKLPNVSLFVLSACETALGEKLGNGIEIFGFGYQLQRNRVRASLASLWKVDDGGTQILMNRFYAALKQGTTVAAAMQQAQQSFINHQVTPQERQPLRASGGLYVDGGIPVDLTHPYYWAPFILIGNGL